MKAVFTKYPYKYWIYGKSVGVMHLFADDEYAERYAKNNDMFLCETPNDPETQHTWSRLSWSYLTCGGEVRIHDDDGETVECIYSHKAFKSYEDYENYLFEEFDMPCIECWECDTSTNWKSVNTGLTYEEYNAD